MRLMGKLQRMPTAGQSVEVSEALYNEALGMVKAQGLVPEFGRQGRGLWFCQQWIAPAE